LGGGRGERNVRKSLKTENNGLISNITKCMKKAYAPKIGHNILTVQFWLSKMKICSNQMNAILKATAWNNRI
jgi:hypothetical protein